MAIKVGNSYVSEAAYAQAKMNIEKEQRIEAAGTTSKDSYLSKLQNKFPGSNITSGTQPFSGTGTNNISIASNILEEMAKDLDKRLEYEALIIDCQNAEKTIMSAFNQKGMKLESHGFIIGSDGKLSSWSVTTSGDSDTKSVFESYLHKEDKNSWLDIIMRNFSKYDSASRYSDDIANFVNYNA